MSLGALAQSTLITIIMIGSTVKEIKKRNYYEKNYNLTLIAIVVAVIVMFDGYKITENILFWLGLGFSALAINVAMNKYRGKKHKYQLTDIDIESENEESIKKIIESVKKERFLEEDTITFKFHRDELRDDYRINFDHCPSDVIKETMGKVSDYIESKKEVGFKSKLWILVHLMLYVILIIFIWKLFK